MAVTPIRLVRNTTTHDAFVLNHEHPDDTPGQQGVGLGPGGIFECNMWVPWAGDAGQYNHGSHIGGGPAHISITVGDQEFDIWQDGDYVCYSCNVGYIPGAQTPVPGNSSVGADRNVDIIPSADGVGWDLRFA
jgi:hypothetical protein